MFSTSGKFNTLLNIAPVKSTFLENFGKYKISVNDLLLLTVWTPKSTLSLNIVPRNLTSSLNIVSKNLTSSLNIVQY
jgi:hypothetical protein